MSYSTEHKRLEPVLKLARRLGIAENPEPEALFEPGSGGFQIWCTPEDHPKGWDEVVMIAGSFSKPCALVASVSWGWQGEEITHLLLETDAEELRVAKQRPPRVFNRPDDIVWAKQKIRWLFEKAGVLCPPIRVEGEAVKDDPEPRKLVHTGDGIRVYLEQVEFGFRIGMEFDKPEAKGTLVLEECAYGFYVHCPEVSNEGPVAILDLFYGSPESDSYPEGKPPLQIGVFSPAQTEDPLAFADCHPQGTRVHFEVGATEVKRGCALHGKEFGLED